MSELETAALKVLSPSVDISYWIETLFSHPEGEWFYPTNETVEDYTVCDSMSIAGLICKKRIPIWADGHIRGYRVAYMYAKDMNFQKEMKP